MKKRALISVYDKTGILDFAKFLISKGIEIISTGGTYKYLKENNIEVIEVSKITNFEEMLDGRVKTLHPNIHGGILAGILTVWIYTRIKKLEFFKTADILVLGLPMAQAIGRWGNFINGEAHGGPTNLPWAILVDGQRVHPTFLYESVWDWLIFIYIIMIRKNKKYEGQLLVDYIFLYSLGRFFIEGLRTDSLMLGPIRMAQLISLVGILVALVVRYFLLKRKALEKESGK